MPDSFLRPAKQVGALIMGAALYVFILIFDVTAAVVNAMKKQFRLPQLTDFRRHEEQSLHIPVRHAPSEECLMLHPISSSEDTLMFAVPPIPGNPHEVLVEVSTQQNVEVSTEIELSLSDMEKTQSETVFLFMHPFNQLPELHYPTHQLWLDIPPRRTFALRCIDVQPSNATIQLPALSINILDWR